MVGRLFGVLLVLNFLATLAAAMLGLLLVGLGDTILYDTNTWAFRVVLDRDQAQAIIWMAKDMLWWAVVPLLVTNAVWVGVTLRLLLVLATRPAVAHPNGSARQA